MQTTPETASLLAELYERSTIVAELDGPQLEAWVSGLYAVFGDELGPGDLVQHCAAHPGPVSVLICHGIAELSRGIDGDVANVAEAAARSLDVETPRQVEQIGAAVVAGAWSVQAPFGRSIVLGFDNPLAVPGTETEPHEFEAEDPRHSILVEVDPDGRLMDLQLAGPPQALVDEATASDDRVLVVELDTRQAIEEIVASWPHGPVPADVALGPGIAPNQQFVRRRIVQITGTVLPVIAAVPALVDIRRGLDDHEYADANRAARSTLQAAVGLGDGDAADDSAEHQAWISAVRGDGGDLSDRERDALLWLEWADWLGVGIGLLREGVGARCSGSTFVDFVNRCPEVSSTIDKADRDYAEWAFAVALDLLADDGVVVDGALSPAGYLALGPALVAAWL